MLSQNIPSSLRRSRAGVASSLLLLLTATLAAAEQQPVEVRGTLDEVIVYRGQALVTRIIDVPGPAGLREVIVTDLPNSVLPESIHAESADGVEVRSVRFRTRAVAQDIRDEVREIDQRIQDVQDEINAVNKRIALTAEHKQYLDKVEQFTAPTANLELTRGVLNAETLKALTLFLFEQRETLASRELELAIEQRQLQEQLNLLQRQRQELTSASARTEREAVVFLNLQGDGGNLRVRYLVSNASWSPSYNIRAAAGAAGAAGAGAGDAGENLTLEYHASVEQTSGEDWNDVRMTLSTATPSLVARAPTLSALQISLASAPAAARPIDAAVYRARQSQIQEQQRALEASRGLGSRRDGAAIGKDADMRMNVLADEMFRAELEAAEGRLAVRSPHAPTEQSVSVSYALDGRTSLPSRRDRQLIQIASLPMTGDFYKLAIPVLTHHVYDEAAIVNTSDRVLLAGPVASYMNGQFVGHGELPTVAVGQQFTVGFGIDSSLRATRELIDKSESTQGGNRLVDFSYRLSIENFGSQPARVRLLDRMPTAPDADVKLTLVSTDQDLSDDPAYQQTDKRQGLLRWEVEVPARAMGPDAYNLDYRLRMEHDRNLTVAELPAR